MVYHIHSGLLDCHFLVTTQRIKDEDKVLPTRAVKKKIIMSFSKFVSNVSGYGTENKAAAVHAKFSLLPGRSLDGHQYEDFCSLGHSLHRPWTLGM